MTHKNKPGNMNGINEKRRARERARICKGGVEKTGKEAKPRTEQEVIARGIQKGTMGAEATNDLAPMLTKMGIKEYNTWLKGNRKQGTK